MEGPAVPLPSDASGLYTKINRWQTRILRLHPSECAAEPLRADLLVADIVNLPGLVLHEEQELVSYEAISYYWGNPVFDHTINVNGRNFAIMASLHGALQRFRLTDDIRYLWADALCINQRNNEEKSFQVQNIFVVFSKALTVLAWLGEEIGSTTDAVQLLRAGAKKRASEVGLPKPTTGDEHLVASVSRERDLAGPITLEEIAGLEDLCRRPWISRAWVQQEVFAA